MGEQTYIKINVNLLPSNYSSKYGLFYIVKIKTPKLDNIFMPEFKKYHYVKFYNCK